MIRSYQPESSAVIELPLGHGGDDELLEDGEIDVAQLPNIQASLGGLVFPQLCEQIAAK